MHPTAARFDEHVRERYGFDPAVQEFPDGTKTAADAADAIGCSVDQIVKSVVLVATGGDGSTIRGNVTEGATLVVLTAGHNRVDLDALADVLGVESVRTADPAEVKAATGWSIGGVPPFGHETTLSTFLDASLRTHDRIWAAAGTPDAVFELSPADLLEFADPEPIEAFD